MVKSPGHAARSAARSAGALLAITALAGCATTGAEGEEGAGGGEASLVLPDLSTVTVVGGGSGRTLLMLGLVICALGLGFGMLVYRQLNAMPVHRSMREVSELIYATSKAYLLKQGRFLLILWAFIAAVIVVYYGVLVGLHVAAGGDHPGVQPPGHGWVVLGGVVRHPGQHLRQLTHLVRRAARAAPADAPHPAEGRHVDRHGADQPRAADDADHPAVPARRDRRRLLHRVRDRRVPGRRRAADRRRHLHQDRRHRLGPHEDRVQDQGGRRAQPRRHRGLRR